MTTPSDSKQDVIALAGRVLLVLIFLVLSWDKFSAFEATVGLVAGKGLPMPAVVAGLTIAFEFVGALPILLEWQSPWTALLFFLWLIPASFISHPFWAVPPAQVFAQKASFLRNVSIMGGMLLLMAYGPGRYSVGEGR